jgi:hypothetical protein
LALRHRFAHQVLLGIAPVSETLAQAQLGNSNADGQSSRLAAAAEYRAFDRGHG